MMRARDVLAFTVGLLLARLADTLDARYRAGRDECSALMGRLRRRSRSNV